MLNTAAPSSSLQVTILPDNNTGKGTKPAASAWELLDANWPNMLGSAGPRCSLLATSMQSQGKGWQGQ